MSLVYWVHSVCSINTVLTLFHSFMNYSMNGPFVPCTIQDTDTIWLLCTSGLSSSSLSEESYEGVKRFIHPGSDKRELMFLCWRTSVPGWVVRKKDNWVYIHSGFSELLLPLGYGQMLSLGENATISLAEYEVFLRRYVGVQFSEMFPLWRCRKSKPVLSFGQNGQFP